MSKRITEGRVGVLMGGISSEREVSLDSGRGVLAALTERGYDCVAIDWTAADNLAERIASANVDVIWNALHGTYGEDGAVQGLLACLHVPGTGASIAASAMAMDKQIAKQIFEHHKVPTPPWVVAKTEAEAATLGFPCVVKPNADGSSVGVTIVRQASELAEALARATTNGGAVLVEAFIEGAELAIGVLGDEVLGSVEIRAALGFYDYQAKYERGDTQYLCPPELDPTLVARAESVALAAYRALDVNSYGRVDLRLTSSGDIFVLEVNTLPGMTQTSLMPKIAAAAGIDYASLCERVLALAL